MAEYENIYVNPWFKLYVQYCKGQKQHKYKYYPNPVALARRLRRLRQGFLGSDLPLTPLVQHNGCPQEEIVEDLSDYLARVAAAFLDGKDADTAGLSPENTAWCCGFFYGTA